MKRLLYLDKKSNEIGNLLNGTKNIVIRAANIKKYPFKMIHEGYHIFFMNNNNENTIIASAIVHRTDFFENDKFNEEKLKSYLRSARMRPHKEQYITNRKYISVFILKDIKKEYATLDHSLYGKKEDWMIINPINEME